MSARKLALATLAILGFAFSGCGSDPATKWDYQYKIGSPGTRSEHIVGTLTFSKAVLPERLGHVVTPVGEFMYIAKTAPGVSPPTNWIPCRIEADGSVSGAYYITAARKLLASETQRKTSNASGSNQKITELQLKQGYYPASFHTRLEGTPAHWLYSVPLSLWIDPTKINEALKQNPQPTLPAAP